MSRHNQEDVPELDEEDAEDEDFEDEEEEDEGKHPKKKTKMDARYYLDEEAEVDDDEDDEEYSGGGGGSEDLIAEGDEVDEGGNALHRQIWNEQMNRRHFSGTNRVDDVVRKIEEREGRYMPEIEDDGGVEGDDVAIAQQSLLPSVRDPKLWMLNCKVGKEREIALTVMQKFIDKENTDERVLIKSVVCPEHLKGHVYLLFPFSFSFSFLFLLFFISFPFCLYFIISLSLYRSPLNYT